MAYGGKDVVKKITSIAIDNDFTPYLINLKWNYADIYNIIQAYDEIVKKYKNEDYIFIVYNLDVASDRALNAIMPAVFNHFVCGCYNGTPDEAENKLPAPLINRFHNNIVNINDL